MFNGELTNFSFLKIKYKKLEKILKIKKFHFYSIPYLTR